MTSDNDNITVLETRTNIEKRQEAEKEKRQEAEKDFEKIAFIQMAKKDIEENLDDADGLISIIFKGNDPHFIWAGSIETLNAVGALELAKNAFIMQSYQNDFSSVALDTDNNE
jgi:hypothetical protein